MIEHMKCTDCITGQTVHLDVSANTLVSSPCSEESVPDDIYCGPGLIDIQVNGIAGVDFNTFPISEEGMLLAVQALLKDGVTSFFPTVITNSDEATIALLENLDQLCSQNPLIDSHVGGIHLEGPFISGSDGSRGAHDRRYIKAPDWDLFQRFREASGNRIKIVTLCPSWENAPSFISSCVKSNVIVAIGHTDASPENIRKAVDAGASLSTHLGNGAPLLLPRNSNFIFEQLAQDQLYTSLIADGFHLPGSFLKIALRMKQDQTILTSDSTMFAGMQPGIYNTHIGGKVVLEANGRLSLHKDQRLLAGAALSLLDGMNHILSLGLADIRQTWMYASLNPGRLIGINQYAGQVIENTDLVVFKLSEGKIIVRDVFIKGIPPVI